MRLEDLNSYEILEDRFIDDIGCQGVRLRHKKTGARVALLKNDDDNKVFYIGFRTPPTDSTGVAHITEHSVLCGSQNFPVKDPFVELCKGSLNTFLNAMTYPDKTVYPVASCNDADFQNLMHVYLDAVFYPNIYSNESIFRQEGWHYEFDDEDNLFINGVVYNEMKGAFSSPDDVLARETMNSLFPDNSYGVESGGDPDVIPELTYRQFLDFHGAYYHPSNSYIYLYGDMDMAEKLDYIDKEYLSKFNYRAVDSTIKVQKPFDKPVSVVKNCNLNEGEDKDANTFLSKNFCLGEKPDKNTLVAFKVIDYVLGNPGAPLKRALIENNIGKDVYTSYEDGILQPYFSVVAKDTNVSKADDFSRIINEVFTDIAENGFDKKSISAAINHFEFKYREADFGNYSKGLIYGLNMLDGWLYDDEASVGYLEEIEVYEFLKNNVETGYFEKLVDKFILNNNHSSFVVLEPKLGIDEEKTAAMKMKMAEYKSSLNEDEIQAIREKYEKLKAFQEQEDSVEALATLPMLSRSDLKKEAEPFSNIEENVDDVQALRHDYQTNGISYLKMLFFTDALPGELIPYLSVYKTILGQVDTAKHSYLDLNNDIDLLTGGLNVTYRLFPDAKNDKDFKFAVELKSKYLTGHAKDAFSLAEEILFDSKIDDTARILEILCEEKSQIQAAITPAGHAAAIGKANAQLTYLGRISEDASGMGYYNFITELIEHFDERKEELVLNIKEAMKYIFRKEYMFIDMTGSQAAIDELSGITADFCKRLYTDEIERVKYIPSLTRENLGLTTAGQVLYVCRAGNFRNAGLEYTGALRVLKTIMGYQYLWVNVRVKGGAYGCMNGFSRTGFSYFVSYRDPNLGKTIEIYENAVKEIENIELDDRTMTQFIIGTVSDIDIPKTAPLKGNRCLDAYITGVDFEMIQKERDEIINAQPEDIRNTAKYIKAFLDDNVLVVVGNAAKIKEEQNRFDSVENLFK